MQESIHIVCPHCDAINRIPGQRLSDNPKCGKCHNFLFLGQPLELSAARFSKHCNQNDIPLLVDFWAPWCGPCKMVAPVLEELSNEYKGKVDIYKIDTEEQQELAAVFGIRSIPSILFVPKEGQPRMAVGAMPKEGFVKAFEDVLGIPPLN